MPSSCTLVLVGMALKAPSTVTSRSLIPRFRNSAPVAGSSLCSPGLPIWRPADRRRLAVDPPLRELVAKTVARYPALAILLFGSRADGTARPDSDWDIACEGLGFHDWAREEWPAPRWSVELDPWQLAPEWQGSAKPL